MCDEFDEIDPQPHLIMIKQFDGIDASAFSKISRITRWSMFYCFSDFGSGTGFQKGYDMTVCLCMKCVIKRFMEVLIEIKLYKFIWHV